MRQTPQIATRAPRARARAGMWPDLLARRGETPAMSSAFHNEFRTRLRAVRGTLNMTQAEMAKALGISETKYKSYEYRSKFPTDLVEQLTRVTHKTVSFWIIEPHYPSD